MAKKVSHAEIINNPINKQELEDATNWWGTLDYRQQHSRMKRHFPYMWLLFDAELIYMYRVGRNNGAERQRKVELGSEGKIVRDKLRSEREFKIFIT